MKKIFTLLTLLVVMLGYSQNENPEQWKKLPGSVTLNDGTVKEGYVMRYSKIRSQKKVRFYEASNDKKYTEYKPDELQSYVVADAFYKSLPYSGLTQKTKTFIERTTEGKKLSLYNYYTLTSDGDKPTAFTPNKKETSGIELDFTGESLSSELIMVKDNGDQLNLVSPKVVMSFKSVMSKYLSECAALAQKISNKESGYGVLAIMKITEEYNNCF